MIFIIAFSTYLSLTYVLLIVRLYGALHDRNSSDVTAWSDPQVSIIVPFRNEEEKLPALLEKAEALKYPRDRFEIILVDDHSEDQSCAVVREFAQKTEVGVRLLQLSEKEGKKAALALAIRAAKYDMILQTDADCHFSRNWLKSMTGYLDHETRMVVGGVKMIKGLGFWSGFAALEYMSLQAITAAFVRINNPIMASGANLLYGREVWDQTRMHTSRRSGDDTFLVQEAAKSGKITFARDPEAQVTTEAPSGLRSLLNQRARWGGKSTSYPSVSAKLLAVFIAIFNLQILFLLFMAFFNLVYLKLVLGMMMIKIVTDYLFLRRYAKLSEQEKLMRYFLPSALLYPVYIALTGVWILFGRADWKGRRFRPVTD